MTKRKRRLKSFKNWLLARDSASRISTFPDYMSFLENSNVEMTTEEKRKFYMNFFDAIIDSKPFKNLSDTLFDFGITKDATGKHIGDGYPCMRISFKRSDRRSSYRRIQDLLGLNEEVSNVIGAIIIKVAPHFKEKEIYIEDQKIFCNIPTGTTDKESKSIYKELLEKWIEGVSFQDSAINDFFRYLFNDVIFSKESRFLRFSEEKDFLVFEVTSWAKQAKAEDVKSLYLKMSMSEKNTGIKEIFKEIEKELQKDDSGISDLKSGAGIIKRFT